MSASSVTGTGHGSALDYLKGLGISFVYKIQNEENKVVFDYDGKKYFVKITGTGTSISGVEPDINGNINLIAGPNIILTEDQDDHSITIETPGGAGSYTNLSPTPAALGGIPSGSTFNAQTMTEMFDQLLYPYQSPAFTSFSIMGQATTLEAGQVITSGSKNFIWTTSNSSNVQTNTIQIEDFTGSLILATGLANDGSETIATGSTTIAGAGSWVWRITGTNTESILFNTNFTVNWRFRMFSGTSTNTTLTESQIEALTTNTLTTTFVNTYSFGVGGYKYVCFPDSFGSPTSFVDDLTDLNIPMASPVDDASYNNIANGIYYALVSVTNLYGVAVNYRVYRTKNILGAAIDIIVS